jgi:hypothetical protein
MKPRFWGVLAVALLGAVSLTAAEITYPPKLPGSQEVVTDRSDDFLKPTGNLRDGITVAKTPPTVTFLFFPGQTYEGKPWSAWGDSLCANGKYYTSVGDHLAPAGNGFIFEYDPEKKTLRQLVDVRKVLDLPDGHYTPGKVHSRLDLGDDGFLYFSTHRGSTKTTTDQFHYKGDWIIRCDSRTGKAEVVVQGPVPKHCLPCGRLDPKRLIWYGGTAPGSGDDGKDIHFFAYDAKAKKVLYDGPDGPARYIALAKSTGRVYYTAGENGPLMRFDPDKGGPPVKLEGTIGIRAATEETPQGMIYTVSQAQKGADATLYALNTKTEQVEELGPAAVGSQQYVASLDADPTGRYLYYVPGAHGGSDADGSAVVQFDTKTKKKKVIAFLHPFYKEKYGLVPKGTYSTAVDEKGERLYITWNISRGSKAWDCVGLTELAIPATERQP